MEPFVQIPMVNGTTLRLPLGCRFTPSDEVLVVDYLSRRACNLRLPCAIIGDAGIMRSTPWNLVPAGEKEKYFFTRKELKYRVGTRLNRVAGGGYWRATGQETVVHGIYGGGEAVVGMKRTLVFFLGNAPNGQRTMWAMKEYRLAGAGLYPRCAYPPCGAALPMNNDAGTSAAPTGLNPIMVNPDDSWVLCRIYKNRRAQQVNNQGNGAHIEQANGEQSPATSCVTITDLGDEENSSADKKAVNGDE